LWCTRVKGEIVLPRKQGPAFKKKTGKWGEVWWRKRKKKRKPNALRKKKKQRLSLKESWGENKNKYPHPDPSTKRGQRQEEKKKRKNDPHAPKKEGVNRGLTLRGARQKTSRKRVGSSTN